MLSKQQKWYKKAMEAGYRRRSYMLPDYLDLAMEAHLKNNTGDKENYSKSQIVQDALRQYLNLECLD